MFYLIYDIILSLKENLQDCGIIVYLPLFEASVRLIFAALWFVRLAAAKYIFIFKYIFQSNISSPNIFDFFKENSDSSFRRSKVEHFDFDFAQRFRAF